MQVSKAEYSLSVRICKIGLVYVCCLRVRLPRFIGPLLTFANPTLRLATQMRILAVPMMNDISVHSSFSMAFLEAYQALVLAEPDSAVSQPLKEAFLALRRAAESELADELSPVNDE